MNHSNLPVTLQGVTEGSMFVKLFTQILDSSIADDRRLRHFFTDLLLCADLKGYVMMTPQAIARRIGADLSEVEWGLAELAKPDPRSKTPDHDGRRISAVEGAGYGWLILNYDFYRSVRDSDQLREASNARVKRFREKKMGLYQEEKDSVTLGNAMQSQKENQKQKQHVDSRKSADLFTDTGFEATNAKPNKAKGTKEEVIAYCLEEELTSLDGEAYFAIKESKGWKDVKDWKAQIRAWKLQRYHPSQKQGYSKPADEPYFPRDDV